VTRQARDSRNFRWGPDPSSLSASVPESAPTLQTTSQQEQSASRMASASPILLDDLGAIAVRGRDRVAFLQGQLSHDISLLSPARALLAGYHTPQGRVIALARLVANEEGEIIASLPRALVAAVIARLRKYVLRSQVSLEDVSDEWRIVGTDLQSPMRAMPTMRAALDDERALNFVPHDLCSFDQESAATESAARERWRLLDVAAGLPQVYAATSETFVAQMLNLDALDGIAFDKGCYTGQEIIARAHYRGRVKRRMQRFRTRTPLTLNAGDTGALADGRNFQVVESARLPDGRSEFLAVTALEKRDESVVSAGEARLDVESLTLPYSLSE